jgi:multiple sugar transport system substrate-binding protein
MGNVRTLLAAFAVVLAIGGCGGSDEPASPAADRSLTVWILESQPERVRATNANVARFAKASGYDVEVVPVGDDELAGRVAVASSRGMLPDVLQVPMASAHAYAREGMLSRDAAQEVVDRLGEETFSARALSLMTSEGTVTAVPSDGWGQLLIYPRTSSTVPGCPPRAPWRTSCERRAGCAPLRAGITMGTAATPFTAETFEHVALASGCQLLDDAGRSPRLRGVRPRVRALRRAGAHRTAALRSGRGVDRDAYFAGGRRDGLLVPVPPRRHGRLRDEAVPTAAVPRGSRLPGANLRARRARSRRRTAFRRSSARCRAGGSPPGRTSRARPPSWST